MSVISGGSVKSRDSQMAAEAKAAELTIELTYLSEEVEKRAEMRKFELMKQRDIELAKARVFKQYDTDVQDNPMIINQVQLSASRDQKVQEYLKSLSTTEPYANGGPMGRNQGVQLDEHESQAMNVNAPEFVPNDEPSEKAVIMSAARDVTQVAKALTDQLRISRVPPPEPPIFRGDPLRYPAWNAAFESLIDSAEIPNYEKMHHLRRYLSSNIVEEMENFFMLSSDASYQECKQFLDERYGNQFKIAEAILSKLKSWPRLPARNGQSIRKFADYLRQCQSVMKSIHSLEVLNYETENKYLAAKLPDSMIHRWARRVSRAKTSKRFPNFAEFVDFVVEEASIACEPVTSSLFSSIRDDVPRRRVSFSTGVESCIFCNKEDHDLAHCGDFLAKPLSERKAFVARRGLCFGCLKWGHRSRICQNKRTCKRCHGKHPTVLHEERKASNLERKTENRAVSGRTRTDRFPGRLNQQEKCAMIVPVWISHSEKPNDETLVYALLDTQSDTTFVLDETCKKLGVSGPKVRLTLSTMHAEDEQIQSEKIKGLIVRGHNRNDKLSLPAAYVRDIMPTNREHIPTKESAAKWSHLREISEELLPLQQCEVGILIGYNCSKAIMPREVIPAVDDGPFAVKTDLGWSVVGPMQPKVAHCTTVKESLAPTDVVQILESDFSERNDESFKISYEDKRFLKIMEDGVHQNADKHYVMPLPFRQQHPKLPNNRTQALQRLRQLETKFKKDKNFQAEYTAFMQKLLDKGYAEPVIETEDTVWYIPHHGVYHPHKPNKIRVVFDCSARFRGKALNDFLLHGPDQTNTLIGVLLRFRKEQFAISCDIEQMFYQFEVLEDDRDYIRFLWWEGGDYHKDPMDYRMKVHLFGATSSPGCANFGLRRCASDHEQEVGKQAADFLRQNFYVDDGLKSMKTLSEAQELVVKSRELCEKGGIHLHKFVSNTPEVLKNIPEEDCASPMKNLQILDSNDSVERPLGVQWCLENDCLSVRITLQDNPLTRRGVLSTVSAIFDPLGFIAPVVMIGKSILQEMCREGTDWDDPLPDVLRPCWEKWRVEIVNLKEIQIERCYKPKGFGEVQSVEYHHFSDASTQGYGQCSYIRLTNRSGGIHVSFLMGKSRVTPLRQVTIPRLELTAAVVSVRISEILLRELEYQHVSQTFWTDSQVTLGYINNDAKRFKVFVANRISQIRDKTNTNQWRYVESKKNPADCASRGLTPQELPESDWWKGPSFLWKPGEPSQHSKGIDAPFVNSDDQELKKVVVMATVTEDKNCTTSLITRLENCSSWYRAKKCIALCLSLKNKLLKRLPAGVSVVESINVSVMQEAEDEIIRMVQRDEFKDEWKMLVQVKTEKEIDPNGRKNLAERKRILRTMRGTSKLYKLAPYVDSKRIIRVGGRIERSDNPFSLRHPIVMPKRHHMTDLIVRHHHDLIRHQGRGLTMNAIRSAGFWILGCGSIVRSLISRCVKCRKLRGGAVEQKMAELPVDRMEETPPFTYCGCDMFGPFHVKEGRKILKRYGCIFTCLVSRAIHVEVASSLSTDSFINALRRFMSVRGPIRNLRCDQGTNFVGAQNEYFDPVIVKSFLLKEGCDFFTTQMNAPTASHAGGAWERQIRSIRNVLAGLMETSGEQLDEEGLRTFMAEATAIVNSRPLNVDNINDVELQPLSPNNLLTGKTCVLLPPPRNFQREDMYARKQWRRVQYLANQFWYRWKHEYLQNLQVRQKWCQPKRNLSVGDIVMMKDDNLPRCQWKLARVSEVMVSDDELVRRVKVTSGQSCFERPVQKLILLLEKETID